MLTTGVMGVLGFFFWLVCTHLFSPDDIGIGTTLISAMSLISAIGLLGFNSTFVRILPESKNRNNEINTGSVLVVGASILISLGYILLIPYVTPKLGVVHDNFWFAAGFVIMVALASINFLTDSIFMAYRAAQYTLITDGIVTSGTKLLLPLFFVGLGAYGVFASAGLAASIGMVASIAYLVVKFGYKPQIKIDGPTLANMFHYSFTNYVANLFNIVPSLLLPIIVIDYLGPAAAGYFFLAYMIINLLYTVGGAVSQSLFVEGSYEGASLRNLLKRSAITLAAIMIPAGVILAIAGPYVLGFFGKSYSEGGSGVIVLLALAAPAIAAFGVGSTLLRIMRQVYSLVAVNAVYAFTISVLAFEWVGKGLVWVAVAWLVGNIVAATLSFLLIVYHHLRYKRLHPTVLPPQLCS